MERFPPQTLLPFTFLPLERCFSLMRNAWQEAARPAVSRRVRRAAVFGGPAAAARPAEVPLA